MDADELRKQILDCLLKQVHVVKVSDLLGAKDRHERFEITLCLPIIIGFAQASCFDHEKRQLQLTIEINTPKEQVKEEVKQFCP